MFGPVFSIGSVVMVCVIWPSDMVCVVVGWLLVLAICRVVASVSSFGWGGCCFLVGFMFGGVGWLVFARGCSLWFWDAASCVGGLSWCFFGSLACVVGFGL